MDADVAGLSDDVLVSELRVWSARIAAGDAYVLRLIGELDAREAWAGGGVLSCAHWVSWQLGLELATARDRVRVARALRSLPLVSAELAAGRMSYAQVRALVRAATPIDEARWLELAQGATAAQLDLIVRGVGRARGGRAPSQKPASRVAWEDDGTLVLTLRISPADAPGVLAALQSAQQQEQRDRDDRRAALSAELAGQLPVDVSAETPQPPDTPQTSAPPYAEPYEFIDPPAPALSQPLGSVVKPSTADQALIEAYWVERRARQAKRDAARAWAEHVDAQAQKEQVTSDRATLADGFVRALMKPDGLPPVTLKVLLDPLSGWGRTTGGELLPPVTLQQVLKTLPGRVGQKLQAASRTRHDLGRRARTVSPALRELLGQIDGERCRFPSCSRTQQLHAHHLRFWRNGGLTDMANLVLVCSRHHALIHEQGFQLVLSPDRALTVRTAGDIPVPRTPPVIVASGQDLPVSEQPYTCGWQGDRLDLGYVVMVMDQHAR